MKKLIKKVKKGFTLVELVVVIAIIAILSAASVATYFGVTESARKSNVSSTAAQIGQLVYLASIDGDDSDLVTTKDGNVVFLKKDANEKLVSATSEEAKKPLVDLLTHNGLKVAETDFVITTANDSNAVTSIKYTDSSSSYYCTITFGASANGYSVDAVSK